MRNAIASITRLAVRFRWITIAITFGIIAAGVYSYTQLNQELLPDIEFPQTFIVAQNGGATSENILHMYSIPLEERVSEIDGVANVEATSRDGLALIIVRNDFGLEQDTITAEIQEAADEVTAEYVPVRRLEPTGNDTPKSMLSDLGAEHLLWLENFAAEQGQGFKQQLSPDVWLSFSVEALQGLPLSNFEQLGSNLANTLIEKRGEANPDGIEFEYDVANPPVLPASWQASDPRFRTVADLVELATNRNIATVLNDFYSDGYLAGPLTYVADLTAEDIQKVLKVEENCRAFFNGNPPQTIGGRDRCSFVSYLVEEGVIGYLTPEAYEALPEEIRNEYPLTNPIDPESGEEGPRLPSAWRAEAINVVTFSFSDIPLGNISISSETLSRSELRLLIENSLIPALKDRDDVADVVLVGGDEIIVQDVNTAIEQAGIQPNTAPVEGIPALPPAWQQAAEFIPDIQELDTADDILAVVEQREARRQQALEAGEPAVSEQPYTAAQFLNEFAFDPSGQGQFLITALSSDVFRYLAANEEGFWQSLAPVTLQAMNLQAIADVQEESGREFPPIVIIPDEPIARTNGDASFQLTIFKEAGVNTVVGWNDVEEFLNEWKAENDVNVFVAFEQASFIEESIQGVTNDGLLGGIMAIIVILIFMNLSVRSTLVTSISIPTSVMMALFLILVVPSNVNSVLSPILEDVGRDTTLGSLLVVVLRLFPATFTLNIMTLSGLTVAIGRVVDDSIVVLENIYRNVQHGEEQKSAVLNGTREVSVAILAATLTTMLVFLPLGLFGGVTGAFFLPFGLAVTYSLVGSYLVAITTVPALSSLLITKEAMPKEGDDGLIIIEDNMSSLEKFNSRLKNVLIRLLGGLGQSYGRLISFLLKNTFNRLAVIVAAIITLIAGISLLQSRPQTFLPDFGEPTITLNLELDAIVNGQRVTLDQTNAIVREIETYLLGGTYEDPFTGETVTYEGRNNAGITTVVSSVGGDAQRFDSNTDQVNNTSAIIRIGLETQAELDALLPELRQFAETLLVQKYGERGAEFVKVSGAGLTSEGFGGFSVEIRGKDKNANISDLRPYIDVVMQTLENVDGLVNVESSASGLGSGETTYIRIDGVPAIQFSGEIEDDDTLGITNAALEAVEKAVSEYRQANPQLAEVEVSQGFDSEQQQEGFQQIFISMGIATLIVYIILALTFGNLIHPITILVSLPLSVVGAGVALTVTDRVLGLSSLIGLLMLIGIVVTNAVVFLDRVQQNKREKNMSTYDALVEAGTVRLRPILMTAISTTFGVFPLALGLTEGAIIAAELGTVVIGGLVSSTILTLIVVPVVYSLFDDALRFASRLIFGQKETTPSKSSAESSD